MSGEVSNRKDPAWKYAHLVDPKNNKDKMLCHFCDKQINGGVYRIKHLAGGHRNSKICLKCPPEVREEIKDHMLKKQTEKDQMHMTPNFDEMDNDLEADEDDIVMTDRHGKSTGSSQASISFSSKAKKSKVKGPMDLFCAPNPDDVVKNRGKGKQTKIDANDPYKKELRERAVIRFMRWMYDCAIPFNTLNCPSFGPAIEAIGQYGAGMKPPSYHEARVTCLKKELAHTNDAMNDHRADWVKFGCSIMCDGWSDGKGRSLINFLVNSPRGSMFIESVDASSYSKDGQKLFDLLDKYVELVGEANVVQVVTDNASANILAGKNIFFPLFIKS